VSSVSKLEAQVPPKCCHLSTKLYNATLLKTLSYYLQLWKLQVSWTTNRLRFDILCITLNEGDRECWIWIFFKNGWTGTEFTYWMFISLGCLSIVCGKLPMSPHKWLCFLCIMYDINIQYGSKLIFCALQPFSSHECC